MATVIAVIGDRFIRTKLLRAAVENELATVGDVDWLTDEHVWPDTPMRHDDEVSEYTGDPSQVAEQVATADVAVVHMAAMHRRVLESAARLRCVACARAGATNVNLAAARERDVVVTNAPGRNARAVAEFTVGALIAHSRGITAGHRDLAEHGRWRPDLYHYEGVGRTLANLTVGIVGFGHVGTLVAQLLKPFGCRLLASDPWADVTAIAGHGAEAMALDQLLQRADVVTVHARLPSGSPPLIGAAEIALMQRGATLIQTARPSSLDYDALCDALAEGRLAGAVVDVYPEEPLPADSRLRTLPNVTLTPHIAGAARESAEEGAIIAARCVGQFLRGESIDYPMS